MKGELYYMLINDVVKRTGLTKKAIRFYEDKKLLSVQRQTNDYRSYSEDNVLTLKKIPFKLKAEA